MTGEEKPAPPQHEHDFDSKSATDQHLMHPVRTARSYLVRWSGDPAPDLPTLEASREHARACLISIPWEGLKLSAGEPALTVQIGPA